MNFMPGLMLVHISEVMRFVYRVLCHGLYDFYSQYLGFVHDLQFRVIL